MVQRTKFISIPLDLLLRLQQTAGPKEYREVAERLDGNRERIDRKLADKRAKSICNSYDNAMWKFRKRRPDLSEKDARHALKLFSAVGRKYVEAYEALLAEEKGQSRGR